jgi:cell division topological specificity factor
MMNLLERIGFKKTHNTALIAKERLQIILSHERAQVKSTVDLQKLKEEILSVLKKHMSIDQEQVQVNFQNQGDFSVLELNVTLPDLTKH